jgi:hypothetical protein
MTATRSTMLAIYAAAMTLAVPAALMLGLTRSADERTRFTEIDVERINIIEPDGTIKLVISNSKRQVEATISGETIPIERERSAGMIFFNDDGDEVGGLAFGGDQKQGFVGLLIDQFKQDQVLGVVHHEFTAPDGARHRMSGLAGWDRPKDQTIIDIMRLVQEAEAIEDPEERAAAIRRLQDDGLLGVRRMFVGRSMQGDAGVFLKDGRGRPRLAMSVSRNGEAVIRFFDENGEIVRTVGAEAEAKAVE